MSKYGPKFDRIVEAWRVIETEHDRQHPDRSQCGGVGGCSMMVAAVDLSAAMMDALVDWRERNGDVR